MLLLPGTMFTRRARQKAIVSSASRSQMWTRAASTRCSRVLPICRVTKPLPLPPSTRSAGADAYSGGNGV